MVAVQDSRPSDGDFVGEVGRVPLYGHGHKIRGWAIVDPLSADGLIAMGRWSMTACGYARLTSPRNPSRRGDLMHRVLLGLGRGEMPEFVVDHVNRDRLDNRSANLRMLTRAENAQNRDPDRPRGVARRADGRFRARVIVNGREFGQNCGTYEEAAALARQLRAEHMPFSAEAEAA